MLIHNGGVDDYRFIESLLTEQIDTGAYHSLGFDVRDFVEAHRSEEAESSLPLLYMRMVRAQTAGARS
jgi:hypothetical protein